MTITATKLFPSGAWELSTIIGARYYRRVFYFYTKRDAMRLFRAYVKAEEKTS